MLICTVTSIILIMKDQPSTTAVAYRHLFSGPLLDSVYLITPKVPGFILYTIFYMQFTLVSIVTGTCGL